MANSFWFKHDYAARNDMRVLRLRSKHGAAGYGVYMMILEVMAESSTGFLDKDAVEALAVQFFLTLENMQEIVKTCVAVGLIIECEHGNYYSNRMLEHKKGAGDLSERRRFASKKRWENQQVNASAMQVQSNCNAIAMQVHSKCNANAMQMRLDDIRRDNKKMFPPFSPELKLSELLWKKLVDCETKQKPPDMQGWSSHFDFMHRIDGREYDFILELINNVFKDDFWKKQIRSPENLRKHLNSGKLDLLAPVEWKADEDVVQMLEQKKQEAEDGKNQPENV